MNDIRTLGVGDVIQQMGWYDELTTIRIENITITSLDRLARGDVGIRLDVIYIRQKHVDAEMQIQADTVMFGDLQRWLRESTWRKLDGEEKGRYTWHT